MTHEERFTIISKEWPALHQSAEPRYFDPRCMYIGQLVECTVVRIQYKNVQADTEEDATRETPIKLPNGKFLCPLCKEVELDDCSLVRVHV